MRENVAGYPGRMLVSTLEFLTPHDAGGRRGLRSLISSVSGVQLTGPLLTVH